MAWGAEKHKDWGLGIAWAETGDSLLSVARWAGGGSRQRPCGKLLPLYCTF